MSKAITRMQAAIPQRELIVGMPEIRALRIYARNTRRNPRPPIDVFLQQLESGGPYPLDVQFHKDSLVWLKDIFLRKDGEFRKTPHVARFDANDLRVIADLESIKFVRMHAPGHDEWESLHRYGHEAKLMYPVFRAYGLGLHVLDFYFVPWQASVNPEKTGLFKPVGRGF